MKNRQYIATLIVVVGFVVLAAVSWHSVQEIHYLKSFFPREFSVEEAYYASKVELIKVVFISLPIVYASVVAYLWNRK